jgi:hypothetical protein
MLCRCSQPGTVREILPLAITDDEVRARDLAAGIDKSFKLAYVELAGPQTTVPAYDSGPPGEDTRSLGAVLDSHVAELRASGWHVETTENSVSVHRYFKNGKPRKGPDISILFNEFSVDAWDDGQGWHEGAVRSTRPYYVSSPSFDRARTFARMSLAVAAFLDEARKLAPRMSPP